MLEQYKNQLEHATILINQEKYQLAESKLANLLGSEESLHAIFGHQVLYLMIIVKLGLEKSTEARPLLEALIRKEPEESSSFSLLARLELIEGNNEKAQEAIDEAIRIDPESTHNFAVKAEICMHDANYEEVLYFANKGLELDPQNIDCLNLRSLALVKQGKEEEAAITIDKALEEDPDNAYTHANYGYTFLHGGDHIKALEHYKIALQIDPMNGFARAGMLEAMKAKFWPYRMLLKLAFKLESVGKRGVWVFLIGGYILVRVLMGVRENVPELEPLITPVVILLVVAFLCTWILRPLMNLYMLTNPYGRLTLSKEDKKEAQMVGVALGLSLLSIPVYLLTNIESVFLFGCFCFLMMIPLSSMDSPSSVKGKKQLKAFALILGITGLGACFSPVLFTPFIIGFVAYQWFANYVTINSNR